MSREGRSFFASGDEVPSTMPGVGRSFFVKVVLIATAFGPFLLWWWLRGSSLW